VVDHVTERTEVQPVPAMFAPGTVLLGKYRVEDKLGLGGFGLVLRAHDLTLDQEVAIKILRADLELDDETLRRFMREAQSNVRLAGEHVVRIFDFGQLEDGSPYMSMELLQGADLGKLLSLSSKLSVSVAAGFVLQACEALAEAHAKGIIHRDIKPTNLFVTKRPDGSELLKVLDFGISKAATRKSEQELTQTASVLGTPGYMSPEQMRSARRVDARSDVWSLGAVLYELVEGRLPFAAENFAEQIVAVTTEPYRRMTVAPELDRVIARCLAKDPDDRYANVAELAAALAGFAEPGTTDLRIARIHGTLGVAPRPRTAGRRRWLVVGAASLVAVAAIASAIIVRRLDESPALAPLPVPPTLVEVPAAAVPPPVVAPEPPAPVAATPAPPTPAPPAPATKPAPARPHPPALHRAPPAHPDLQAAPKCDPYKSRKGC
jgi:serine/threonine-protein kinase